MADVVVIGGGIVGSSAAYHLARDGLAVTLVDRADAGQATAAGAGIIAPGLHFQSQDAFYPLAYRAVQYYPDLLLQLAEVGAGETGYQVVGALFVAMTGEEAERIPDVLRLVRERKEAGAPNVGQISPVDLQEARRSFPALGEIAAGFHTSGAARVDGRSLRDALQRAAQTCGVTILRATAEPVLEGERVTSVRAAGQILRADAVVLAGGAWSADLTRALGISLPVYPQRGQILHLDLPDADPSGWPIILGFHSHYILTFPPHRVVAGATREDDSGYDPRITAGGVYEAIGEALRVAPGLARATLAEVRVGLRPASPDRLPFLGPAPSLRNVYLATGHGPVGLQLGPYSGLLVSDLLQGKPLPIDLSPFAPSRFGSHSTHIDGAHAE